jgi:hypothetical protein
MKYRDLERRVTKEVAKKRMRSKKIWFVDTDDKCRALRESGKAGPDDIIFVEDIAD